MILSAFLRSYDLFNLGRQTFETDIVSIFNALLIFTSNFKDIYLLNSTKGIYILRCSLCDLFQTFFYFIFSYLYYFFYLGKWYLKTFLLKNLFFSKIIFQKTRGSLFSIKQSMHSIFALFGISSKIWLQRQKGAPTLRHSSNQVKNQ